MKRKDYVVFLLFLTFPFFIYAQKEKTITQNEQIMNGKVPEKTLGAVLLTKLKLHSEKRLIYI